MDDALKTKISTLVSEFAKQEQERLAQAGTFIELEELAVSIGDMVSRELTNTLLSVRSEQVSHITHHPCPDCGKEFEILEQEPRILRGRRGEIEFLESCCHCTCCRRDFFPSLENTGEGSSF